MKDSLGLVVCVVVYTIAIFGLGSFLQMKADQRQLKNFTDIAWKEGCHTCAKFEKDACMRDELRGLLKQTEIPQ